MHMEPGYSQTHRPASPSSSTSSLDAPKRRQSIRLASKILSRGLAGNSPTEESPSKRRKYNSPPEGKSNTVHPGARRKNEEGGKAAKPSSSSTTSSTTAVRSGRSPKGINGSTGTTTFAARQNKPFTASHATTEDTKGSETDIPASQLEFPLTQSTLSQRGRRRLMCLDDDDMMPSQDLIQPVTPNPEERRNGPYTDILHPPSPKRKRRHNRELFSRKSPNAQTGSQRGGPSNPGKSSESVSSDGGQARLRSGSDGLDLTVSSGDDNVFPEERLEIFPRPRRSTEEFKIGYGFPVPKKSARGKKGGRRASVPASLLCLTSVHSR